MFWDKFKFPIIGLSPMDGVTDAPMRFIAKKYGRADVIYTEFVSAEGLWRLKKRGEMDHKIWKDLIYDRSERPVIAQLFGSDPDSFYEAAKIIADMGFDGIDINMGCPSPGLEKREGGAGLIRNQDRARAVIEATRRGVEDWRSQISDDRSQVCEIPVSVKTRIGSAKPDESWWKFLAGMKLPAVAMHGRTFKQLYSGEADWEILLRAGEVIRDSGAKFLPNGDVEKIRGSVITLKTGKDIDLEGKADGVLIGREAIGNPWVLRGDGYEPTLEEKLNIVVEHSKKYEIVFPDTKFFPMRKHLVKYVRGFDGATELRKRLVLTENSGEVEKEVNDFLQKYGM